MPDTCIHCGQPVSKDEIGLTKKLINRGTTQWLCFTCLSRHFRVTVDVLLHKVEEFREMGCTLFESKES